MTGIHRDPRYVPRRQRQMCIRDRSDADLPALDELLHHAADKGVPGVELWDGEMVRRAEPRLTDDVVAAVRSSTTAVINPYEACFGLAESAVRRGVEILTGTPVESLRSTDGTWAIGTPDGPVRTRFVLLSLIHI